MNPQDMERRVRYCLTQLLGPEIATNSTLQNLGGHASLRIYWRIHLPENALQVCPRGEPTLMAMVMPLSEEALKSDEGNASDAPVPTELPFANVQRWLNKIGMPVPEIDYIDLENGVLFLEDLGNEMFENAILAAAGDSEKIENIYREAIDLLVAFQSATLANPTATCIASERAFTYDLLYWELDHYREWGLEARLGKEFIAPYRPQLDAAFQAITNRLLELPQTIVLRDYQSRNIMRKNNAWVLIDFQDALRGSFIYDLVALLRDSYIDLAPELVQRLVAYYADRGQQARLPWCAGLQEVETAFHLQTIQRKLKDAGRFVFIDRVKNNPSFLSYYDPSIEYVQNALANLPEFENLHALLLEIEPAMKPVQRNS